MISGIRAKAEVAVRAGYKLIQFSDLPEEFAECVDEYLMSLKPVPSPYLVMVNFQRRLNGDVRFMKSLIAMNVIPVPIIRI